MEAIMMVCNLVPKKFGGFETFLVELGRSCRGRGIRLGLMLAGEPIPSVAQTFQEMGVRWIAATGWMEPNGK